MTYVCVTGNEQSPSILEQRLERVLASHPRVLCELRLDFLDLSPAAAFSFLAKLPAEMAPRLILTQRLKASGALADGHCSWDVVTWQSWWRDVMALRPWFAVDLDWLVLDRLAGESLRWQGKFRSRHAFFSLHGTLAEVKQALPELVASAREHNAGAKIACPVKNSEDLWELAELSEQLAGLPIEIVVAMGATGRPWRWSRLAKDVTYFAVEKGLSTAPGQEPMLAVLPYLQSKQRPDLYLLLGDSPENRYGEERWNRAFLQRGAMARYVNCATADPATDFWRENILRWMEKAQVKGASVTKPYKLSFSSPTNTLTAQDSDWSLANTDGQAVAAILKNYGLRAGERVVIAGGGGAAQGVRAWLEKNDLNVSLWVREDGRLESCPAGEAFVSTWPGTFQEALVQALPQQPKFRVVLDAQFSRSGSESPLAQWCVEKNIPYIPGSLWWKEQARGQDLIWFGADRLGKAKNSVLNFVPTSKSETLRALALSAACGVPAEILGPAKNVDTDIFLEALGRLGVSSHQEEDILSLFPPKDLVPPKESLFMGEGATGLRIMGALSTVMKGEVLRISGTPRLEERPSEELRSSLGVTKAGWPMEIPVGAALPKKISVARSSQFATAFLLAAAGALYRGMLSEYTLELEGEMRSEPYLRLTLALMKDAGIGSEFTGRNLRIFLEEKKKKFVFAIEKDASSLSFLEVYGDRWRLSSFFQKSRQGDGDFPYFLSQLKNNEPISLGNHPDLAPPLWSAAVLLRKKLEIVDCPQLHWKESDRAHALVEAAKLLGAKAEERDDGLLVDFQGWIPPTKEIFLPTEGDHRLAMAFGLLSTEMPVHPDRRDCVSKSFPAFWQALDLLEKALPG